MSRIDQRPGATPVAALDGLEEAERRIVGHLRRWCQGPAGQAAVWNELAVAMGPGAGRRALAAFEACLGAIARHARRTLCHHAVGCPCVGADEAAIAALIAAAGAGDRKNAATIASVLVASRGIEETVQAAAAAGAMLAPGGSSLACIIETARTRTLH